MTTGGDDKDAIVREVRRIGEEWIEGKLSDQEYFRRARQLLESLDPVLVSRISAGRRSH
jgi:hypothetical protein